MPDQVKIPVSLTEYQARFERPHIPFIDDDRRRAVVAIIDALLPFGLHLTNSEVVTAGNLAEHKAIFKLPERGITMQMGRKNLNLIKRDRVG